MAANRRRQAVEGPSRHGYLRVVSSSTAVGATPRCLVVDDDAQVRHAIARVIESHGLSTAEASSGSEALALLHRLLNKN